MCNIEKNILEFYIISKTNKPTPYCKECWKSESRAYYEKNKEEVKKRTHKYQQEHKDIVTKINRKRLLKYYWGMTLEEFDLLVKKQNGCCSICNLKLDESIKKLYVDHDHKTGKIRGLLCGPCNLALGGFKDSTDILQRAIEYLMENK